MRTSVSIGQSRPRLRSRGAFRSISEIINSKTSRPFKAQSGAQRNSCGPLHLHLPLADSSGRRSEDTRTTLIQWGGPRPIDFDDGISIFTANKAAPPVHHVRTPQFLHLDGHHKPLAARTTHRHLIYFPFWQISTFASTLPSCGLII